MAHLFRAPRQMHTEPAGPVIREFVRAAVYGDLAMSS